MRSPEDRARRWLRLYPRSYRENRGEELVGTLLDVSGGSHLQGGEVMSVAWHAARARWRQSRPVLVAAVVALAAAGATYAYQEVRSSPASYSSTAIFIVESSESGLSPSWVKGVRSEVLAPPVIARAEALWQNKQPVCSLAQVPSTNLFRVTCTSPRRLRSIVPLQLLSAYQTIVSPQMQSARAGEVSSLRTLIAEISRELKNVSRTNVSRTSHRFLVITRNLATERVDLRTVLSQAGISRAYRVVQGGRLVEHRAVNVSGVDVMLTGIVGALLALAASSIRKRRQRPLQPA